VFEPCDQSLETGIDLMLRPDQLSG
jgi:hypothetical protein